MGRSIAVACILLALMVALSGMTAHAVEIHAAGHGLSPAVREKLQQQKVLITSSAYRQIFEPYLKSDLPVFITSDALIGAFHVLLDDAMFNFEQASAGRLPGIVRLLWHGITPRKEAAAAARSSTSQGAPAGAATEPNEQEAYLRLKQDALFRARFVIGVALRLLGDTQIRLPEPLVPLVDQEVLNIVRASGISSPAWPRAAAGDLPAVDYALFRPIGFYSRSEALQRYYRAIRWFQTYPFVIDRDAELLAILMLGKPLATASAENRVNRLKIEKFFKCHRELTGDGHGFDILLAAQIRRDRPDDLDTVRSYLRTTAAVGAQAADNDRAESTPVVFHVIAPPATTDDLLFEKTIVLKDFERRRPTGLEVCAAIGSQYAGVRLSADLPPPYGRLLLSAIADATPYMESPGIFNSYLKTLAALVDPPEPDAPPFFSDKPWQAKSCNTVLAGWVQYRHRFGRDAYASDYALGDALDGLPPGFVEPDPEFFGRMGDLVTQVSGNLERCGVFAPARFRIAADLRRYAGLIEEKKYHPAQDRFTDLSEAEVAVVARSTMILEVVGNLHYNPETYKNKPDRYTDQVLDVAKRLELGEYDDDPTYQALIIESGLDTRLHWQSLQQMCRWLENLAHKQLRGVAFNKRDTYFLTEFGERLAGVMLYGGYSYLQPRDNTPAVVSIFKKRGNGPALHAAVGRPREILVLYPSGGKEVLSRGGILPYYEFIGVGSYSDVEWKTRLDSDERPAPPQWMAPVLLGEENN